MDSTSAAGSRGEEPRPRRGLIRWLVLAVLIGVVAMAYIFDRSSGPTAWATLSAANPALLAAALAAAVASWVFTALSMSLVASAAGFGRPLRKILPAYLAGNFCGLATPFGSGGTPGQAYFLSRLAIEPGAAFAIAVARGLISSVIVAGSAGAAVVFARGWLPTGTAGGVARSALVLVAALLIGAFLLAVSDRPAAWADAWAKRARRPRIRRFWEAFASQTGLFNRSLRTVARRPAALAAAAASEVCAWVLIVAVGPLVLASLGWTGPVWILFLRILALFLVVPLSPTPGSAGTAEVGFFVVGHGLVPSGLMGPAVLLWRLIMYYLPLVVGGGFFVWLGGRKGADLQGSAQLRRI